MKNKRQIISISLSLVIHMVVFIILVKVGIGIGKNARVLENRKDEVTIVTFPVNLRIMNSKFGDMERIRSAVSSAEMDKRNKMRGFKSLVPGKIEKFPKLELSDIEINSESVRGKGDFGGKQEVGLNKKITLAARKAELPMPSAGEIVKLNVGGEKESDNTGGIKGKKEPETERVSARGGSVILWKGKRRSLKSAYPIRFPTIIKRIGRDVDVEAEIVVAPGGNVIRVKIVKSSGYEEVDRIVESALWRYMFSADPNGNRSIGRLKVHFILKPEE